MSLPVRLAIALGVVFLLGALATTFIPSNPQGIQCKTWVHPEWPRDKSEKLGREALKLANEDPTGTLTDKMGSLAVEVANNYKTCNSTLAKRRTISLSLLAAAIVAPIAVLFVGGGITRRRPDAASSDGEATP